MINNSFGYITKRLSVLSEARPTKRYTMSDDDLAGVSHKFDFVDLRKQIGNIFSSGLDPKTKQPLVDSNGNIAVGITKGKQYRLLLYTFSHVYNAYLDQTEGESEESDLDKAKKLLTTDIIYGLKVHDDIIGMVSMLKDTLEAEGIDISNMDDEELAEVLSSAIEQNYEVHDTTERDPMATIFFRDPIKNLAELSDIDNITTSSEQSTTDTDTYEKIFGQSYKTKGDDTVTNEEYQKTMATIARQILAKFDPNPASKAGNPTERMERAIGILLRKFPRAIFTKEFVDNILDPTNIANFINGFYGRSIKSSGSSVAAYRKIESKYDMSVEEYDRIVSRVKPILNMMSHKIGNASKGDKSAYVNTSISSKPSVEPTEPIENIHTLNIDAILITLDLLISYKEKIDTLVSKRLPLYGNDIKEVILSIHDDYPAMSLPDIAVFYKLKANSSGKTILDSLMTSFLTLEDKGIDLNYFKEQLELVKGKSPNYSDIINMVIRDVDRYLQTTSPITRTENKYFPGFPDTYIEELINTPEKREAFKEYYNKIYKRDIVSNMRLLTNYLSYMVAHPDYNDKSPIDIDRLKTHLARLGNQVDNKPITGYAMRQAVKRFEAKKEGRAESMDAMRQAELADRYSKTVNSDDTEEDTYEDEDEDPFKESYIMSYMSEQVNRDKLKKPRGEFRERGFKKMTYHQWLENNQ